MPEIDEFDPNDMEDEPEEVSQPDDAEGDPSDEEIPEEAETEETDGEETDEDAPEEDADPAEEGEEFGGYRTEAEVPAELRPNWRRMQADYTRKTQEAADGRKVLQAAEALGIPKDVFLQALTNPQPQQQQQPEEIDYLSDSIVAGLVDALENGVEGQELFPAERLSLQAQLQQRVEQIQDRHERQREAQSRQASEASRAFTDTLSRLQADPVVGPHLQREEGIQRLQAYARAHPSVPAAEAARVVFFDDILASSTEKRGKQAAQLQAKKQAASLSGGKPAQTAKTAIVKPKGLSPLDTIEWIERHPEYDPAFAKESKAHL